MADKKINLDPETTKEAIKQLLEEAQEKKKKELEEFRKQNEEERKKREEAERKAAEEAEEAERLREKEEEEEMLRKQREEEKKQRELELKRMRLYELDKQPKLCPLEFPMETYCFQGCVFDISNPEDGEPYCIIELLAFELGNATHRRVF